MPITFTQEYLEQHPELKREKTVKTDDDLGSDVLSIIQAESRNPRGGLGGLLYKDRAPGFRNYQLPPGVTDKDVFQAVHDFAERVKNRYGNTQW